jgi:ATP-binding cassette subfamily C protein
MADGRVRAFGPKDEVLSALKRPAAAASARLPRVEGKERPPSERPVPLRVVADAEGALSEGARA